MKAGQTERRRNREVVGNSAHCSVYRSRALKRGSKLRAAIRLRAAFGNFLLHRNSSLFTVMFVKKSLDFS